MVRPRIYDEPMPPSARRKRSDEARLERGEQRVTAWLSPEASAALKEMLGPEIKLADLLSEAVIQLRRKKR